MATTNRTFDVAIWCADSDRDVATASARKIARHNLRVSLRPGNGGLAESTVNAGLVGSPARVDLLVVGGGASSSLLQRSFSALGTNTLVLLAPSATTDKRWLETRVPCPVRDARTTWDVDSYWHSFSQYLSAVGRATEATIDARCSLTALNLRRSTICSYNEIAEQFAETWFDHPPLRELDAFLRRLRPKSHVLDAGCGPGHHARMLASAGHHVTAVDLSDAMLDQARKRVRSLCALKMDIEALSFPEHTFDAIWCAATVLHVPRENLLSVLREFWRVMKPNGVLGLNFQIGRASEIVQRQHDHRFFEYYTDGGDVAKLLDVAGFDVEASLCGKTRRNTHNLDITLEWATLYARRALFRNRPQRSLRVEYGEA